MVMIIFIIIIYCHPIANGITDKTRDRQPRRLRVHWGDEREERWGGNNRLAASLLSSQEKDETI